jgi:D-galacturonate reductase
LGPFSFFTSYMSQPKKQLQTFGKWAGSGSDISYYLNTHHVDLVAWILQGRSIPVSVVANSSRGFADQAGLSTEDVITLMVQWQNLEAGTTGTSVHTASWIAPKSDVHSQQRFHYVGHRGEVTVDQAHRGYTTATDQDGYSSVNPLYMKYSPDAHGYFNGQRGYGYTILESFLMKDSAGSVLMSDSAALWTSAIMEAGRRSLDAGGAVVDLIPSEDPSFPGRLEVRGKS